MQVNIGKIKEKKMNITQKCKEMAREQAVIKKSTKRYLARKQLEREINVELTKMKGMSKICDMLFGR